MIAKKNNGEVENLKRAIRTIKKEIIEKKNRILKLHPIKDIKKIKKIETSIIKKQKQKLRLEQKLGENNFA